MAYPMLRPERTPNLKTSAQSSSPTTESRLQQTIDRCRHQLARHNGDWATWLKLGDAILAQRENAARFSIAMACYRRSLELNAGNPEAWVRLGSLFKLLGQRQESLAALHRALELEPGMVSARFALLAAYCPVLYECEEDIGCAREEYAGYLATLSSAIGLDTSEQIERAAEAVGIYPFHLAYQGHDDRVLQQTYGQLVCRIQAARYPQWSIPLPPPPRKAGEPLRIGVVSGFFRNHATWNFPVSGLLAALDRKRFALYGYHTGSRSDQYTDQAREVCTCFIEGDFSTESLCRKIFADRLHLLLYPEIGMNRQVVRLSALRLAPVQCVSWGHSTSSGLPTMDYFLSSDLMEPEGAVEQYSEMLVRIPHLGVYYPAPKIEAVGMTRTELGLNEEAVLYLCLQSLFKYLPQYDELFPRIALKTGDCRFVFLIGNQSMPVVDVFRRRLADAFARHGLKSEEFVLFLPYLDDLRYYSLYRCADVFLDSIGWSGCNTTLDAVARDLPVVTLPGSLMRGRQSMAILKRMGVTETIATSTDDYVRIAARLGTDLSWRNEIIGRMAACKQRLYADRECIDYLERFFESAVADAEQKWARGRQ